jgi:CRISPR-associated endonuclease/helicase Cas3
VSYADFFHRICEFAPFPFQVRFRESEAEHRALVVPTGLGKTNAVIADWLDRQNTTRLVYCLPGRTLTRQIAEVAGQIVERSRGKVKVIELMGGSEDLDLTLNPHERAILVGTQDILVSRALNRGYARSPFRWPIDFGLLNNDTFWVFDEVQLLGEAVATSAQLAAFRKEMQTFGRVPCVWMSATFALDWLKTVDFREAVDVIGLDDDDKEHGTVRKRLYAAKRLEETAAGNTPQECAAFVKNEHRQFTLVICNTVSRAQEIWEELRRLGVQDTILLHSRFRPCDREGTAKKAIASRSGIIVSTQVVEAGIDIDADLMVTDVAPWASLVQRFGRVNRLGEGEGRIYWVRSPQRQKGKPKTDGTEFLPYDPTEVREAIAELETMHSAAPADLTDRVRQRAPYHFVLRRSDLLDLFDTTSDLAGNQIDVSRFVRIGEEKNVYLAWREWSGTRPDGESRFVQDELCAVPFLRSDRNELKALLQRSLDVESRQPRQVGEAE